MKNIRWSYFSRSWAALSTAGLCGMYSVLSFAILLCPPRPRFLPRLLCWHGHYLHRDRKVVGIALLHLAPFISVQFVGHQPAGGSRSGVVTNSESIWKQHWGYCWEYLVAFHNLPQPFWFGLLAGISSMEALFWSHVLPFAKSRNDLPLMSKLRAVSKTAVTEMEWKETVWKSMKDEAQDSVGAVFTENPSHRIYMQKYIAARLLRKVKVLRNDLSLTAPLDSMVSLQPCSWPPIEWKTIPWTWCSKKLWTYWFGTVSNRVLWFHRVPEVPVMKKCPTGVKRVNRVPDIPVKCFSWFHFPTNSIYYYLRFWFLLRLLRKSFWIPGTCLFPNATDATCILYIWMS